jgi:pyruvate/2-oxoglutarate dehydrogenase complex dihydrolipoamide acyltransferase (E2) component
MGFKPLPRRHDESPSNQERDEMANIIEFKLPDIGEGVAEGEITSWKVKPGDQLEEDQVMVEVMTDKATVEIGSPARATVLELRAQRARPCRGRGDRGAAERRCVKSAPAHGAPSHAAPAPAAAAADPPGRNPPPPRRRRRGPPRRRLRRLARRTPRISRRRSAPRPLRPTATTAISRRSTSRCPTSARASPRARSPSGWSGPATR